MPYGQNEFFIYAIRSMDVNYTKIIHTITKENKTRGGGIQHNTCGRLSTYKHHLLRIFLGLNTIHWKIVPSKRVWAHDYFCLPHPTPSSLHFKVRGVGRMMSHVYSYSTRHVIWLLRAPSPQSFCLFDLWIVSFYLLEKLTSVFEYIMFTDRMFRGGLEIAGKNATHQGMLHHGLSTWKIIGYVVSHDSWRWSWLKF